MKSKKILWLSRHDPLPAQIKYLKEKFGDIEIEKKPMIVKDANHAMEIIKESGAEVVIPVLPQSVIMHITPRCAQENILILRAEMELLHECEPVCSSFDKYKETWINGRHYKFLRFNKLKEIKIIEEPL